MPDIKLDGYFDRYDPDKNYERILFRADHTLQSAEMNEMQRLFNGHLQGVADAIFKDGDVIRDGQVIIDESAGIVRCEAGLIYMGGAVRQVPPAILELPPEGLASIGVFLSWKVITELEDPTLYNPAIGTRSEGERGAARLMVQARWGLSTDTEKSGDFYPVHTVEDGELLAKEPPPNLDAVTQALARYDRDSAGGTYVVSGLTVRRADDSPEGHQVYTVAEGRARVYGYAVELTTSRRLIHAAEPDLLTVESEPHLSANETSHRINLDRYPVGQVLRVRMTRETTATQTHGGYTGCHDPLPDTSVVELLEIKQGSLTYKEGTDYKLTAGKIDWSPGGNEPAPHSTYTARYRHMVTLDYPEADVSGLTVTGAVVGTQIFVDYTQMLPRYDRLCVSREGAFVWVIGVAAEWNPRPPQVGDDLLALATIHQTWDDSRRVINDGVRVVPMDDIAAINDRLDEITEHVAQQRLTADIFTREAGAKKGLFVDPFLSDEMRDQGLTQTGAIVDGCLTLPIHLERIAAMPSDLSAAQGLAYSPSMVLEQLSRTGSMKINPYSAFDPLPAEISLTPAIDRWTEVDTRWASAVTRRVSWGSSSSKTETLSHSTTQLEYLRQIDVAYRVTGFGPGENMTMTFDGLPVNPSVTKADANGVVAGKFRIPAKVPAGSKLVNITGSGGSQGSAVFVGQGQLTVQTLRVVNTVVVRPVDPLAQTFTLAESCQLCSVDLWFTAKHTSKVVVQIRETTVGLPNQNILGEAIIQPAAITVGDEPTRVTFKNLVTVAAETEYAIVAMCDDDVTSLAVAELGKWDVTGNRWVTAQPYQVGVLLSSSNASTWTPHQDRDLAFRLYKAVYTQANKEINLGRIEVNGVTDLMLLTMAEHPSAQTRTEFRLTMPDATSINVADQQPVRLPQPVSGHIGVTARLAGTAAFSPVLYGGSQLICATADTTGDYISRAVPAGQNSRVRVIVDAHLPAGSRLEAALRADGAAAWSTLEFTSSRPLDEGWQELIFESPTNADLVRVKLILTGTSLARPRANNLRVLTI